MDWLNGIEDLRGPRYLAIAQAIGDAIDKGQLKPAERLPTHRDLAYHLGVTVGTVSRAYAEAVRRNYVNGEVGRGTYVNATTSNSDPFTNFEIPHEPNYDIFDFSLNFPAEGNRVELLRRSLMQLAQDDGLAAVLRYQTEHGMEHHRDAMAQWAEAHGAPFEPERIIISNGVQNAMTLSLMALSKPGDKLMCEEYSYPGIKSLASQLGLKVQGIKMDEEGILPDDFEKHIIQSGARMLYCMPNYQNPTTVIMSLERRHDIARIAQKHGVWIIEDDIYGFLSKHPEKNTPFAKLLPDQTFYLNGASKAITPGVRVGFVLAPKEKVATVAGCMRLTSWMAAPMNVELVTRWIKDGTAQDLIAWHHEEAVKRQRVMKKHLTGYDLRSTPRSYHGWLLLPEAWSGHMFSLRARELDVSILPASVFHTCNKSPLQAVRICFGASPDINHVEEGMRRLGQLITQEINAFHPAI